MQKYSYAFRQWKYAGSRSNRRRFIYRLVFATSKAPILIDYDESRVKLTSGVVKTTSVGDIPCTVKYYHLICKDESKIKHSSLHR